MAARSDRVANWLRDQGVQAGQRIVVMLGNQVELWEIALAAMKLRAVVIPATPLLGPADLRDRIERGKAAHVIVRAQDTGKFQGIPGDSTRPPASCPAAIHLIGQRPMSRIRRSSKVSRRTSNRALPPDTATTGGRPVML